MEILDPRLRRNPTSQERNTIMELLMATEPDAADICGVSRSSLYRLIAATQVESIKVCRSRRVSVASIRYVAATSSGPELVESGTERFPESTTPEEAEEACHVLSV
jgi:predicted DNA-binding transcriptional regulator AlpA